LGFGQGGFATLERYADQERVLAGGDILAAKEIDGFNASDFRDAERANAATTSAKWRHRLEGARNHARRREARDGLVLAGFFCFAESLSTRRKPQLGEEDFLTEF